ncbi:hypothetical protein [uncultured Sphaerochaeta sp.]|uniref:hypothetical protein n=1 Tax=uncultured Sphaerochaeta sp. TaxID=886478 RepID=UPI002A0A1593|nr:hypothetical protein [uncultured Sphaerochaeta sp.]
MTMKKARQCSGILFWFKDSNNDIWVLIGRRQSAPCKGMWSIPFMQCEHQEKTKLTTEDIKNTALMVSQKEFGLQIDLSEDLKLLGTKKGLFKKYIVFAYQYTSMELPPLKNNFLMVMWSKSDEVPKPHTLFLNRLLGKLKAF